MNDGMGNSVEAFKFLIHTLASLHSSPSALSQDEPSNCSSYAVAAAVAVAVVAGVLISTTDLGARAILPVESYIIHTSYIRGYSSGQRRH